MPQIALDVEDLLIMFSMEHLSLSWVKRYVVS